MAETPLASLLARRWALEVKPVGGGEFTRVRGINSFQPSLSPTMEDSTDFDNDGWSSSEKTLQGWSLSVGYIEKVGQDETAAQDPGQLILEEASDKFGGEGFVEVRWFERGGGKAYEGNAAVQYEPQGGGPSALSTVNVTLNGNGKRERVENPEDAPVDGGSGE